MIAIRRTEANSYISRRWTRPELAAKIRLWTAEIGAVSHLGCIMPELYRVRIGRLRPDCRPLFHNGIVEEWPVIRSRSSEALDDRLSLPLILVILVTARTRTQTL